MWAAEPCGRTCPRLVLGAVGLIEKCDGVPLEIHCGRRRHWPCERTRVRDERCARCLPALAGVAAHQRATQ
eukprot:12527831-Alexandrium_andersonii.AAC.1